MGNQNKQSWVSLFSILHILCQLILTLCTHCIWNQSVQKLFIKGKCLILINHVFWSIEYLIKYVFWSIMYFDQLSIWPIMCVDQLSIWSIMYFDQLSIWSIMYFDQLCISFNYVLWSIRIVFYDVFWLILYFYQLCSWSLDQSCILINYMHFEI